MESDVRAMDGSWLSCHVIMILPQDYIGSLSSLSIATLVIGHVHE